MCSNLFINHASCVSDPYLALSSFFVIHRIFLFTSLLLHPFTFSLFKLANGSTHGIHVYYILSMTTTGIYKFFIGGLSPFTEIIRSSI